MIAQKYIWFCLVFFLSIQLRGQEKNLIPNPGFEDFSAEPLGWFYNGQQFSRLIKYWYSPTMASPDAFGKNIIVPNHWRKRGFGKLIPYEGQVMTGLTLYGCSNGKPHCREYLQIALNDSLVIGQEYALSFYVGHLDNSIYIDKLGVLFTKEASILKDDNCINNIPQLIVDHILKPQESSWEKLEFNFIADSSYNFITIGNFFSDSLCRLERDYAIYEYAYYYFDQFNLKKVPPIIPLKIPESDLSKMTMEIGKSITLKNIYFDLDKSDLLPRSFIELDKLIKIMKDNPDMYIEIHGHTDIQGEYGYNIDLSQSRAESVAQYLISSGIEPYRLCTKGFGFNLPVAENDSSKGRKLNRRVEILITAL